MSAHSLPSRRGWFSALAAQVADYVLEPVEDEPGEPALTKLEPHPVIAVVSAAPHCGASTVARLLAAELAHRRDGSALVVSPSRPRRAAPPSRNATRLATALTGVARVQPTGRLCLTAAATPEAEQQLIAAARYLAPIVMEFPPDGSAARARKLADRIVVVGRADGEPALLEAVARIAGGDALKVVNRVDVAAAPKGGSRRTDDAAALEGSNGGLDDAAAPGEVLAVPDSRIAARAAVMGTRPLGALGAAVAAIADTLERPTVAGAERREVSP